MHENIRYLTINILTHVSLDRQKFFYLAFFSNTYIQYNIQSNSQILSS